MNYNEVINLIKVLDESNIKTFEINFENAYINLSKLGSNSKNDIDFNSIDNNNKFENNLDENIEGPITILPNEKEDILEGSVVKSPIVGTFYNSSSPEKPPYVKVGDVVKKGDVLCIVEAMKVMNEVKSEFDGIIKDVLIEDENIVEYGQPLFIIG